MPGYGKDGRISRLGESMVATRTVIDMSNGASNIVSGSRINEEDWNLFGAHLLRTLLLSSITALNTNSNVCNS